MLLNVDKREIQKQWDSDPCGASTVASDNSESAIFYGAIRDYRYKVYGPWFDAMMRFDDTKHQDILEIGVGLGSDHLRFAQNCNRMTAVDLSREHLRHARQHLAMEGLSTDAVYGDAEQLGFSNETFDTVYAFGVLHHTPDIRAALSEIHRVLRPGGTAIIGLYHLHSWFFWIQTFLVNGMLKGGLWKKGPRRLMSEIEYRKDSNSATPIVRVYSRRQVTKLFRRFSRLELHTCHVEASHFGHLRFLLCGVARDRLERWLGWGGWYVIARAVK
jgi:ubiquinone/menaquinone biosynthesis C-methylase UbiE